jgi:hypothetical protein
MTTTIPKLSMFLAVLYLLLINRNNLADYYGSKKSRPASQQV